MRSFLQQRGSHLYLALVTTVALLVRLIGVGRFSGYIYDEAYYVATAQNLLGLKVASGAAIHPPLVPFTDPNLFSAPPFGKEVIAAAIWLFGNHPWAWRLPGVILGASLPLAGWLLARRLFGRDRRVAGIAAALLALEGLGIGISRVALLDSVGVPLAIWGLVAVLWAGPALLDPRPPRGAVTLLLLAGVLLGLATATKWTGAQALLAAGASLLAFLIFRLRSAPSLARRQIVRALALWFLALVPLPVLVYGATYAWGLGRNGFANGVPPHLGYLASVADIQRRMLNGMWDLRFTHPWLAPVSTWFLLPRPIYLISAYQGTWHSAVYALANPFFVWVGGLALLVGLVRLVRPTGLAGWPGSPYAWTVLWIWTLAFYGTWWLTPRSKFDYYFYPMTAALAVAAAAWAPALATWFRSRAGLWVYGLSLGATTAYLFPLWVGISLPGGLYAHLLWSPTWNPLPVPPASSAAAPATPRSLSPLILKLPPAPPAYGPARQWGYSAAHEAWFADPLRGPDEGLPAAGPVVGQVAVDGGRVFSGTNGDTVTAWNAVTGRRLWTAHLVNQVMTLPLVVRTHGRTLVIVGLGNNRFRAYRPGQGWMRGTGTNALVALDASTGRVQWSVITAGEDMPTPAYAAGRLYEVTGTGQFLAVDAASGRVLWTLQLKGFDSMSSLAWAGSDVVFATNQYLAAYPAASSEVWAVDVATRRVSWAQALPVTSGLSDCSPAVLDGRVYIAGVTHIAMTSPDPTLQGRLFALSLANGRELWSQSLGTGTLPLDQEEVGIPLATADAVYEGNPASGRVFAFQPDGRLIWSTELPGGGRATASPVWAGSLLLWPTSAGEVDVLASATGRVLLRDPLPTGAIGPSSPVLAGSTLWFGTLGGYVDGLAVEP